ncbi:MAG: hypothetical protein E7085_02850 [Parabacteroides distasonis]|jgi:hypothetical protein|nr:hypothetical protein [Parabacteroides distasonis]
MMRKELGKFFIDVAKLILAGVVITAIMREVNNIPIVIVMGVISVIFMLSIGLFILKEKEDLK